MKVRVGQTRPEDRSRVNPNRILIPLTLLRPVGLFWPNCVLSTDILLEHKPIISQWCRHEKKASFLSPWRIQNPFRSILYKIPSLASIADEALEAQLPRLCKRALSYSIDIEVRTCETGRRVCRASRTSFKSTFSSPTIDCSIISVFVSSS